MKLSKLNSIVQKQIASSTEFWAGKLKLGIEELSAVESFAKKKGEMLDAFCSSDDNKNRIESLNASSQKK